MKGTQTLGTAAILLAVSTQMFVSRAIAQQTRPGRDDRLAAPRSLEDSLKKGAVRVVSATLTPLSATAEGTTARLAVRFDPDRRGGPSVAIQSDGKTVVLRDDGTDADEIKSDGIFSAMIVLTATEIAREQRTAQLLAKTREILQFKGRVQLQPVKLPPEAFQDFRSPTLRRPSPFILLAFPDPLLKDRSLMITDTDVKRDPLRTFDICSTGTGTAKGKWTFNHLMTQMAIGSGKSAAAFTRDWLRQWEVNQTVNSFTIPARTDVTRLIVNPWPKVPVFPWFPWGPKQLDMTKAPFRLLAIVNRVDLRQNLVYGGGSAGEARFIFEAIDRSPDANGAIQCKPMPFTVIFEYGIHKNSCSEVKAWGKQWYDLRALAPSTTAYRDALETITEQFVPAGSNPAQLPNHNALSQLRTNERAIGRPWELREFTLASSGSLVSGTVKREPDMSFHDTDKLVDWINNNAIAVAAGTHSVPDVFPDGTRFLGARAPIPNDNTSFFWDRGRDITTANARQQFSLGTCSGCHTGETKTVFTHVTPVASLPQAPPLSGFLTGINVLDPDVGDTDNTTRNYNDLLRRALDLDGLVNSACIRQIVFNNISMMTH